MAGVEGPWRLDGPVAGAQALEPHLGLPLCDLDSHLALRASCAASVR